MLAAFVLCIVAAALLGAVVVLYPDDAPGDEVRFCERSGWVINRSGVDRGVCARCFARGEVGDCPQYRRLRR